MAQNDAAFEAYKTLHTAGLVNDNLLPVQEEENHEAAQYQIPDNRPSTVPISPTFDPWLIIAQRHQEDPHVWCRTLLEVKATGEDPLRLILLTPVVMPSTSDIVLYWNETKRYKVESSRLPGCSLSLDKVQLLRSITWKILHSVFPGQVKLGQKDFLCLLAPCDFSGAMMNDTQLCEWHAATEGQRPASERLTQNQPDLVDWGLVTLQGDLRKFMPKDINVLRNQAPQALDEIQIQAVRLPKRRDFLHPVLETGNENDAYIRTESVSASTCSVDNLPTFYSIFALLFPSILHRLEIYMVADVFRTTHLKPVSFDTQSLPVIITALTSSATGEDDNYQRLEFLGDCILKFITSVHLMAVNLRMPEGMLTGKKGRLVSNGYLARAALSAGLERFIFYKRFTGAKWKPRYVSQVLASGPPPAKQQKSSKVVADIIESMIGASYIVGGFPKAFACIQTLLPLEVWTPIPDANVVLYNAAPTQDTVTSLPIVEALTGHTFTKKALLLEALTHSSFHGVNVAMSYERSEFMGDAVLDYIVSKRLYAHKPELSHRTMHGIRTAMVNASFLTFRMLETTVTEDLTSKETLRSEGYQRALWQFIRSESPELIHCRDVALRQHADARVQISEALTHDGRFPWHLLSLTDPPKFLSDVVESVIGAIYIDTHGDISACEVFVRRLGILSILERILRDSVDCLHPKERLGHLAVEKDVKYVCVKGEQATTPEGKKLYRCQVKVGGKDVGGVVEGVKKLNAETIAAWRAVRVLENGGADDVVTTDSMEEGATEEEEDVFFDAEEGGGVMLTDL
jgi:dsRNA-specific ribonuclease